MTWRTDIRTPGLPPDTRRLGDLRLECLVGEEAELISDFLPFFGHIAKLLRGRDYCNQREVQYLFFAERPLFSVTLCRRQPQGGSVRRSTLCRNQPQSHDKGELQHCDCEVLIDRTYYSTLGDPSWPDDTLLKFEYMEDGVAAVSKDSRLLRHAGFAMTALFRIVVAAHLPRALRDARSRRPRCQPLS